MKLMFLVLDTLFLPLFYSRIDESEQQNLPPVSGELLHPIPISNSDENLDNKDEEVLRRLEALKADRKLSAEDNNDQSIASRLADLKGVPMKDYSKKILFEKDTRTETEKANDLLKQFAEESGIDSGINQEREDAISDIEKRLADLRGQDILTMKKQIEQVEETEEEERDRIMRQYLDEAKLDDILDPAEKELIEGIPKPDNPKDIEELPFCEICNEDATLRCLDCENLFCKACLKEFHLEEDYKDHQIVSYKAPKNSEI